MASGTVYWRADEVEKIAARLISTHHEHLQQVPITYVFRDPTTKSRGRVVYGKARKISGLPAHLVGIVGRHEVDGDPDFFVIEIAQGPWKMLDEKQRVALVDHELCHLDVTADDNGERQLVMRGHDVEEFSAVVERHGLWRPAVAAFAGVAIGAQLELNLRVDVDDGG